MDSSGNPPTRLLDVGPLSGLQEPHLHICDRQSDKDIRYVALSHSWGNASIRKSEKATLKSLINSVPLKSLSRTFQDAIRICRRLTRRYLWIDSLCIIQDDKDDWKHEAGTMASVYANYAFSLAALHGVDSEAGCFVPRDPRFYLLCKLPATEMLYGVRLEPNMKRDATHSNFKSSAYTPWSDESLPRTPLLGRGWVFQERILPPKTVYFGAKGVHWECRTLQANDGHSTFHYQELANGKRKFDLLLSEQKSQERHKTDIYFRNVTQDKSNIRITQPETHSLSQREIETSEAEGSPTGQSHFDDKDSEVVAGRGSDDFWSGHTHVTVHRVSPMELDWS